MEALDQCIDFLGSIFEPEDIIEFRPLPPAAGRRWSKLAEIPDIVEWLARINRDERSRVHAYFGANPRKQQGASESEGVALARCLFADFDGGIGVEDALSRIKAAGYPMPTAIIESGGGVHTWWRLTKPVHDSLAWSQRMKAMAAALGSDQAVHDWPRIMRLPGFINWKHSQRPLARLWDCDGTRVYGWESFEAAVQGVSVKHHSMSDLSRRFVEDGFVMPAGRRQTMFTVACDLAARGWGVAEATEIIMQRMRLMGLGADDLDDCPRQVANAWKKTRSPVLGQAEQANPVVDVEQIEATPTLADAIAEWMDQDKSQFLETGMPTVDSLFGGGLPLGQMTALAAAPGVGKSALALHLCLQILMHNPDMVCMWCLGEMTMSALAARAITNYGDGELQLSAVLDRQEPSRQVAEDLAETIGNRFRIVKAPLVMDRIEQAITKDKPGLLVVDYLQLVRTGRNMPDKTGEINECLVRLRELTMIHEMSTVIVTNVAKGCTEDTDIGNIGKGSNQIDFDVDNFLYGHRINEHSEDGGQLLGWKCKKLRQGQMQDLKLWFYGGWQRFDDPQHMIETDAGQVREVEPFPEFEADRGR
jgi:RecA/RadA recombinase